MINSIIGKLRDMTEEEDKLLNRIYVEATRLDILLDEAFPIDKGRMSVAKNKLEECVIWTVKAIKGSL